MYQLHMDWRPGQIIVYVTKSFTREQTDHPWLNCSSLTKPFSHDQTINSWSRLLHMTETVNP